MAQNINGTIYGSPYFLHWQSTIRKKSFDWLKYIFPFSGLDIWMFIPILVCEHFCFSWLKVIWHRLSSLMSLHGCAIHLFLKCTNMYNQLINSVWILDCFAWIACGTFQLVCEFKSTKMIFRINRWKNAKWLPSQFYHEI